MIFISFNRILSHYYFVYYYLLFYFVYLFIIEVYYLLFLIYQYLNTVSKLTSIDYFLMSFISFIPNILSCIFIIHLLKINYCPQIMIIKIRKCHLIN